MTTTLGPSRTALLTAVARGVHRLYDDAPWIIDDPFALPLVGPNWPQLHAVAIGMLPDSVDRSAVGLVVGRSRYAEDRLGLEAYDQFVILGAGLDSFAWRRPDLRAMRVFEVDRADMQAWKRNRAAELSLPTSERHVFVPLDLDVESLDGALDAAGFDRTATALFAMLGVTIYLTVDAIRSIAELVGSCAPGSELVLTYSPPADEVDPVGHLLRDSLAPVAIEGSEAYRTLLSAAAVEALLAQSGLEIVDHPTAAELNRRYFAGRRDGLTMPTSERLLAARGGTVGRSAGTPARSR